MSADIERVAVVTGAGSGLGREISLGLAARGYRVFGTAFATAEVAELDAASGGAVRLEVVDIVDSAAVGAWAESVQDEVAGVDLLMSNAGILTPGPIELLSIDDVRREFEVNTFGPLRVVNAFLPSLRAARGRIVQISTITATVPLPFNAASGASKAAAEVFADVYRAELKQFGIDVTIVSPGSMLTGGPAKSAAAFERLLSAMTPQGRELYGAPFARFAEQFNANQGKGITATDAATQVIEVAEEQPAPSRRTVGPDAAALLQASKTMTDDELDALRLQLGGLA
ncbi:SDR family NAD(P)-dependent oxidoreductase [Nocardioides sp. MJB4]|uniref:SDR family NAD(P)-dependent oxidoreductase n=1 Tax=Nocardioides donggukensis TaxID=2774019 RepID=A0A927K3S0_9ACTN|nr:SDR family NAD(P)-dependent oxidoreductase [Nocardioides donggukensis]